MVPVSQKSGDFFHARATAAAKLCSAGRVERKWTPCPGRKTLDYVLNFFFSFLFLGPVPCTLSKKVPQTGPRSVLHLGTGSLASNPQTGANVCLLGACLPSSGAATSSGSERYEEGDKSESILSLYVARRRVANLEGSLGLRPWP